MFVRCLHGAVLEVVSVYNEKKSALVIMDSVQ